MPSTELLRALELVIGMRTDHQAFLFDTFQYRTPLVKRLCYGQPEPLLDVWKAIPTWKTSLDAARHDAFQVMDCLWASVPCLLQDLWTYLTVQGLNHASSRHVAPALMLMSGSIIYGWRHRPPCMPGTAGRCPPSR